MCWYILPLWGSRPYCAALLTIDRGEFMLRGMSFSFRSLFPEVRAEDIEVIPGVPVGEVVTLVGDAERDRHVFVLGEPVGVERLVAHHRSQPFWMSVRAGVSAADVPPETQFLMLRRGADRFAVVVPLIGPVFRCALQGGEAGGLEVVAESGDTGAIGKSCAALYVAEGEDPYRLVELGAEAVARFLGVGRLRREKPLPSFVDLFGWCTWDAFYKEVSAEKLREGLESFRSGGVSPKWLVLDDGWQSYEMFPSGEGRLTGLAPNAKFGGDLSATVRMTKAEFGLEAFFVWHAFTGYWGGIDAASLPGYRARRMKRKLSSAMQVAAPWVNEPWGAYVSVIDPDDIARFFHDYHRVLRAQGVDGVKVDVQVQVEMLAEGFGGRVRLMQRYREALEGAAAVHFGGNLINCMALSNDVLYQASASTVTRASDDFYPGKPKSHGRHLVANAHVGFWFGEFVHPDWDMFQSGHAMGAFHAAGRAVSGGAVYVSDKPGAHDFEVLRKLVLANGRTARASGIGVPSRDCLFHDPVAEPVALKVSNRNAAGGVLGIFNCQFDEAVEEQAGLETEFGPDDVEGLEGESFAVLRHSSQELRVMRRGEREGLALGPYGFEVVTVAPIREGVAVVGFPALYNAGGAVRSVRSDGKRLEVCLKSPGRLLVLARDRPASVEGGKVEGFERATGWLLIDCRDETVRMGWEQANRGVGSGVERL